jgi:hypothetical protein
MRVPLGVFELTVNIRVYQRNELLIALDYDCICTLQAFRIAIGSP